MNRKFYAMVYGIMEGDGGGKSLVVPVMFCEVTVSEITGFS